MSQLQDNWEVSTRIQEVGKELRQTIAQRRAKLMQITGDDEKIQALSKMLEEERLRDEELRSKHLRAVTDEASKAMPVLTRMDPEVKKRIIQAYANQERNWAKLAPSEIRIPQEEVSIWKSFLGTAKREDFRHAPILKHLEQGEIAQLEIAGFRFFEIVNIRSREKDAYAVSVVRFQRNDMQKPIETSYFISLPLIEGSSMSIVNQATMKTIASHKIHRLTLNKEHKSLVQKFLEFIRG